MLLPAGTINGVDCWVRRVYEDRIRDAITRVPRFDETACTDWGYRNRLGENDGRAGH